MSISDHKKNSSGIVLFNPNALQQVLALGSLIIMFIVFSLASPNFLTINNLLTIVLSTSVIGLLAIGVTFIIITGGIDLSIGTAMTFSSVIAAVFITVWKLPIPLGVLAGILTGAFIGFINGNLISNMKLPPFIATLGMMMITRGFSLVITGATPIYFIDTPNFSKISMGSVVNLIIPGLEIPNVVLIFFGAAIIASLVLTKTVLGRYTFAIGSNEEAVRLSGINVSYWKVLIYSLAGLFIGLAGIMMAARLNSAQPALGQGYELDAIAAVVIGGTSLNGGEGTITGTIIGAFIMSVLLNGLRILSVPQEWQIVVSGTIVVLAVYMDIVRRKKK